MSQFEFDPQKSASNLVKHGIDFVAVQALWLDPDLIEIEARSETESRFLLIGRMEDKHWSVIITYREEKIRIISARRSRKSEVNLYES